MTAIFFALSYLPDDSAKILLSNLKKNINKFVYLRYPGENK